MLRDALLEVNKINSENNQILTESPESCSEIDMIDVEDAMSYINSNRGVKGVLNAYETVQNLGIYSIPTLIIDGTVSDPFVLQGAAHCEDIVATIESLIINNPNYTIKSRRAFNLDDMIV